MEVIRTNGFRGDMLKLGMEMRGLTFRAFAQAADIKLKTLMSFIAGTEPDEEALKALSQVLDLPVGFFYREGEIYERDPRYPLDFFVPLVKSPVSRETIAGMLQYVPEGELEALAAYVNSVAEYGAGVTKIEDVEEKDRGAE